MRMKLARLRIAALVAIACISPAALADDLALPGTFTLTWNPPTENEDGTPLTDLLGYYVWAGDTPDSLAPILYVGAFFSSITLRSGVPGQRFLAVSAVNVDGIESSPTSILLQPQ
jgi:hypothetical protein